MIDYKHGSLRLMDSSLTAIENRFRTTHFSWHTQRGPERAREREREQVSEREREKARVSERERERGKGGGSERKKKQRWHCMAELQLRVST